MKPESATDLLDIRTLLNTLIAFRDGDFSVRLPVDQTGIAGKIVDTMNDIFKFNHRLAMEFERISKAVGKEGKINERASLGWASGGWAQCVESVNSLIGELVQPSTEVARVIGSVAKGDLSQTMALEVDGRELKGEFLHIARLVNRMVVQLNSFASEVTRVAREVGTDGKLGGQAEVNAVAGVWKDLTDSVNSMAGNLTAQVRNIAEVTTAVAKGDLSHKITVDARGEILELKNTVNTMVDQLNSFASEVTRVAREVGTEGNLGGQAEVKGVGGVWKDLTDSVNSMAGNLTAQVRNIAEVTTAVANGDLSRKITVDVRGEILQLKNTINTTVDQLNALASEVTRVAREVGTEGKLGAQAEVRGVAGTWKDLTDSVNSMAHNLTAQVRNIAEVTTAVAQGDLSRKITVDVRGEILQLKNTINTMVDQLGSFASEVTRVAREVGTEGKLGGQADVPGVAGTWKDLTDNVNSMAGNLTAQVRNIAEVTTAVARGDLSRKITVAVHGEILELKNTINTMVDQLNAFAGEVTRVAREVGTEGKLGGQADVRGAGGTWKDLTDSVNSMAVNLTAQVRNIAEVTTAVARGDLSRKITVDVRGEILELKNTINTMVDQLNAFAGEVTRVAREVGTEGKLGGQADVRGVAGTWKDLTDSVNSMATNLTNQVRNIAGVTTAVAKGDLTTKITVDARGEILELKNTINTMVDQLGSFASEVTRVAREVGTEGKLGGQAHVKGVAGTWMDLTDSVNSMAANLTMQVRNIAEVTTAVAMGVLSRKITVDVRGEILELKNTINTMVDQLGYFSMEITRVAREVGTEGKLGGQAHVRGVAGIWKDLTDNVNSMARNLTAQVRNIAKVTTAVANGDLSRKITLDVHGEILELKNTINTMVDQLNSFASEVTRVAREVGTEGKLGGQAEVRGVGGTWKDLTDNVNSMAANLTTQVRGIARVVTDVANGNLKRKLVLETKGEIAQLAETINGMIDTLAVFADQVSNVAREVGIEGKLGGQARVPGAAGIWRDLTDNVNQLAANLTTQVRAIADVATSVTNGDLTRSIAVEAQGEVAALKDNINEMIGNLAETTRQNTNQDWLKTNIAKFTGMMQGQRDLLTVSRLLLSELAPLVGAQHGTFYIAGSSARSDSLKLVASYGTSDHDGFPPEFRMGEGLVGECALGKSRILVTDVPDKYVRISSSLGAGAPASIVVLPVLFEGEVKAVVELASFRQFTEVYLAFLDQLTQGIGITLNTIAATMRTEQLLQQSQALAEQLQKTNAELEEKAQLLAEQKSEVETKKREVEQAKGEMEEKAEQLSLASKYKSEFLANMSHELRTPLNNLLILAQILSENAEGTLTPKQVKYAETIHSSGTDLLALINDILDLTKIESGKMDVELESVGFAEVRDFCSRTFRHVAEEKGLEFYIEVAEKLVRETITTDAKRLQQVLKNLLSNALKFTDHGSVRLRIETSSSGWSANHSVLSRAESVIAFAVSDTGVGIRQDKQRIIFEAFQQADGTTSRKYGGTGLGLSISRELTRLLGGEIRLRSTPGEGSTFTLYLPQSHSAPGSGGKGGLGRIAAGGDRRPALVASAAVDHPRGRDADVGIDLILPTPPSAPAAVVHEIEFEDDRNLIKPGDKVLMMIGDDVSFARTLVNLARDRGIRALVAMRGSVALPLAREFAPGAITLDISLPDMTGWTLLDRLKHDSATRHIPVHVITANEDRRRAMALGAMTYLEKSTSPDKLNTAINAIYQSLERRAKKLLIVAENHARQSDWRESLGGPDVESVAVGFAEEALSVARQKHPDCVALDIRFHGVSATQWLEQIQAEAGPRTPPAVICGRPEIRARFQAEIQKLGRLSVVRHAESVGHLLEETVLLLHRAEASLSESQKEVLAAVRRSDAPLVNKKVLIVDDDVRNIFALTTVLEQCNLQVVHAENGKAGIEVLRRTPGIDGVVMDIMMPGMDGYETMKAIRQIPELQSLPIIAVTAKAMKGDRDKCIEAGASDYITKPVDLDQLYAALRVCLASSPGQTPAPAIAE